MNTKTVAVLSIAHKARNSLKKEKPINIELCSDLEVKKKTERNSPSLTLKSAEPFVLQSLNCFPKKIFF